MPNSDGGREVLFLSTADFCAYMEKIKILCYNGKNCTMQPAVDEFQVVVWWYATYKKVILDSSDGDTPHALSSGGIEK